MNESIPEPLSHATDHSRFEPYLDAARRICAEHMSPLANSLDQQALPPTEAVLRLGAAGLLGLTVPEKFGGLGAPGSVVRHYTETLAAACATTTFVQGQHLSACNLIVQAGNELLKQAVLPAFAKAERICGIAFSHLRRPGKPLLTATPVDGGYHIEGEAPWFTGWGVMTDTVLGATLPDGRFLYSVVPISSEHFSATEPMRLCAMNASATVLLTIKDLFVPEQSVFKTITPAEMDEADRTAILNVMPQIFGVCTASLRLISELGAARKSPLLESTVETLQVELNHRRAHTDHWRGRTTDPDFKQQALAVRAACIEMGVRFAHAALVAGGGGANHRDHTAQRLCREALFYSLTAQTRDVQSATLEQLVDSSVRAIQSSPCP